MNLNSVLRAGTAVLLVGSVSLFSAVAKADITDIKKADNAVTLEAGAMHMNYKERVDGGVVDSEKGWLPAGHLGVSYLAFDQAPITNLYVHLDVDGSHGSTKYGGAIISTGQPWYESDNDTVISTDLQLGYAFPIGNTLMLTPYGEIGYRYWDRQITGGGYASSNDEEYTNFEGMVGLLAQFSPISRLVLSLSGSGGTTFGGSMKSSAVSGTYDLGDHHIWRVQGRVGFRVTEQFELTGSATYEEFGFGASPCYAVSSTTCTFEPDSTTHQMKVLAGFAYHFF